MKVSAVISSCIFKMLLTNVNSIAMARKFKSNFIFLDKATGVYRIIIKMHTLNNINTVEDHDKNI